MSNTQSLRAQLLIRLAVPLAFFIALDVGVSYVVTLYYTNLTFDRWLLDSARSLAQEVKVQKDKTSFELPATALEVFRWDDVDRTFFRIESERSGFIAGDMSVPSPPRQAFARKQPVFFDGLIDGDNARVVSMWVRSTEADEDVLVQVAETVQKRRGMMAEILLADLLPQFALGFIAVFHLGIGIRRGLHPLNDLAREIAQRSPRDLTPIPDTLVPLEVRVLTHTINDLLRRLSSSIAAQQRFIANAAHQLRTPLAGLKLQVERALLETDIAAMRPALQLVKNATNRVSHLNSQLLVLARAEPTDVDPRFAPVNLEALASDICAEWVPRALVRKMELGFSGPSAPVVVQGNETLLRELLNNLLDNAICYGREHGEIAVSIDSTPHPRLTVEDDGPGIPASEYERIFERFYRIPGSVGEGCGLGLAIVREIAELHGAHLKLRETGSGQGVCVEIHFVPHAGPQDPAATTAIPAPGNPGTGPSPPAGSRR